MEHQIVQATKPGQPPLKLEKRTHDAKFFQIDLTNLLAAKEDVYGIATVNNPNELLTVESAQARQKKFLLIKLAGGPTGVPYEDYQLHFEVNTTSGSVISVSVSVRVYSI